MRVELITATPKGVCPQRPIFIDNVFSLSYVIHRQPSSIMSPKKARVFLNVIEKDYSWNLFAPGIYRKDFYPEDGK